MPSQQADFQAGSVRLVNVELPAVGRCAKWRCVAELRPLGVSKDSGLMATNSDKSGQTLVLPDTPPFSEAAVHTWFGVAVHAAQTFETALATFTIIVRLAETPGIIPSDLQDNPFASLERKTLGQVLARARQVVAFDPDLDGWLQDAVRTRNHLSHHFFPVNESRMESEEGRSELVDELRKATRHFLDMAKDLDELTDPTVRVLSISPSELDALVQSWRDKDL